jgi:hypothetical protein
MSLNQKTFKILRGRWKIEREIKGIGKLQGIATFKTIDDDSYIYREDGIFQTKEFKEKVYKEYIYILNHESILTYFYENNEKKNLFLKLNFEKNNKDIFIANYCHLCNKDKYNSFYEIYDENKFKITYKVDGPEKNYISQTFYMRLNNQN